MSGSERFPLDESVDRDPEQGPDQDAEQAEDDRSRQDQPWLLR